MQLLLPNKCFKCGAIDEPRFTYAGPHIKKSCNSCGCYVEFFTKSHFPDVKEIKLQIWALVNQDLNAINEAKKEISFVEGMSGIDAKMMYWKLYLKLREHYATL